MPDLIGEDLDQAAQQLTDAGLYVQVTTFFGLGTTVNYQDPGRRHPGRARLDGPALRAGLIGSRSRPLSDRATCACPRTSVMRSRQWADARDDSRSEWNVARSTGRLRSAPEHLGHQKCQLQRLLGVQPGVTGGLVTTGEVGVGDLLGTAEALGDVLAGQLDVDPAGVGAEFVVDLEEALHLVDDAVEVSGLVARRDSSVLPCIGSHCQITL